MPAIDDGESVEIKGSAREPYVLKNVGGVFSCTCPAWRMQSAAIERRTCKHLRQYCGEEAEQARLGTPLPERAAISTRRSAAPSSSNGDNGESASDEPGLLLAHPWSNDVDLSGWWMSEKLDGVRAYWDGKRFISRQGNVYQAPDWFIEDLPTDIHLDGELWLARKAFQRAVSIVRRQDKNDMWQEIRFLVFDAPKVDDVFEARMAFVAQCLDELRPKYARPHVHERCNGIDHLLAELGRVEALGGEGLMMRKPGSRYEVGRSYTLLKVKSFHDAEARVVEHLPGTGKHKGRLGALSVELAGGTRFSVGTGFSDAERNNPPPVNSIITFRYQELSDRGVPRFPSFVRVRTDIDVLAAENSRLHSNSVQFGGDSFASAGQHREKTESPVASSAVQPLNTQSSRAAPTLEKIYKSSACENLSNRSSSNAAKEEARTEPVRAAGPPVATNAVSNSHVSGTGSNTVSAAASSKAEPQADTSPLPLRYFEFVDDRSSKFWEVKVVGSDAIVRFGRIGSEGQTKAKSFPTARAARNYYKELIGEKLEKGYVEKGSLVNSTSCAEQLDEEYGAEGEDEEYDDDSGG